MKRAQLQHATAGVCVLENHCSPSRVQPHDWCVKYRIRTRKFLMRMRVILLGVVERLLGAFYNLDETPVLPFGKRAGLG